MSIAEWSEGKRRLFALGVSLLFVCAGFFIATGNVGDAAIEERGALWRLFSVTAIGVAALMGWYSWRKLTNPHFDTKLRFEGIKILLPAAALGIAITRLLPDEGAAPMIGGGVTTGFFGAILLVYGYDAVTNNLSNGRSWRARQANDGSQSNTSSPI